MAERFGREEHAPRKSTRSYLAGVTGRFSNVLEKRCSPFSVNVNNQC